MAQSSENLNGFDHTKHILADRSISVAHSMEVNDMMTREADMRGRSECPHACSKSSLGGNDLHCVGVEERRDGVDIDQGAREGRNWA
jgi:hypothetical protein